mmetsp:Transcript_59060/g.156819  ORF Transcript_59060/g.156819 Transcript_59060/m.156819 type:complete len:480 (+) Transcript_59060:823-2262(+)
MRCQSLRRRGRQLGAVNTARADHPRGRPVPRAGPARGGVVQGLGGDARGPRRPGGRRGLHGQRRRPVRGRPRGAQPPRPGRQPAGGYRSWPPCRRGGARVGRGQARGVAHGAGRGRVGRRPRPLSGVAGRTGRRRQRRWPAADVPPRAAQRAGGGGPSGQGRGGQGWQGAVAGSGGPQDHGQVQPLRQGHEAVDPRVGSGGGGGGPGPAQRVGPGARAAGGDWRLLLLPAGPPRLRAAAAGRGRPHRGTAGRAPARAPGAALVARGFPVALGRRDPRPGAARDVRVHRGGQGQARARRPPHRPPGPQQRGGGGWLHRLRQARRGSLHQEGARGRGRRRHRLHRRQPRPGDVRHVVHGRRPALRRAQHTLCHDLQRHRGEAGGEHRVARDADARQAGAPGPAPGVGGFRVYCVVADTLFIDSLTAVVRIVLCFPCISRTPLYVFMADRQVGALSARNGLLCAPAPHSCAGALENDAAILV